MSQPPPLEIRHEDLDRGDRHARRNSRGLVDEFARARDEGDFLDELAEEVGDLDAGLLVALGPRFLRRDLRGGLHVVGVVRPDLGGDPVLQRRDDVAAVGVVLGVGREHEQDVERDADREAADLQIALLEDVQEADLDAGLEVRQLVDREDPAVGARHDAEVDHLFVGIGPALRGRLDGVHVADEIRDRHVGRRELLPVPLGARNPRQGRVVALLREEAAAVLGDRQEGVLVQLAAGDRGDLGVEQVDEHPQETRLGLPAQAEEKQVVLGQDRVVQGGKHGSLVTMDSLERVLALGQGAPEVLAKLLLDAARPVPARFQLAECLWLVHSSPGVSPLIPSPVAASG